MLCRHYVRLFLFFKYCIFLIHFLGSFSDQFQLFPTFRCSNIIFACLSPRRNDYKFFLLAVTYCITMRKKVLEASVQQTQKRRSLAQRFACHDIFRDRLINSKPEGTLLVELRLGFFLPDSVNCYSSMHNSVTLLQQHKNLLHRSREGGIFVLPRGPKNVQSIL